MHRRRIIRNLILILIFTTFLSLVDNPWKLPKLERQIPIITPFWNWIQDSKISLGLDLQGGTQLDYEIDLRSAQELNTDDNADNDVNVDQLLEGVKDVIQRRVDSLGVAEAHIYLSSIGEERHIVVELPGVKDIAEAKEKVGKVVQLEFKTEKPTPTQADYDAITVEANNFFKKVQEQKELKDLEAYVEDSGIAIPNRVEYRKQEKAFLDELPEEFKTIVKDLEVNTFSKEVVKAKEQSYIINEGQYQQPEGFNILRVTEKSVELRKRPVNAEDFTKVMGEFEQKPSEDFVREGEITPAALSREVTTLGVGEISGVIETDEGLYVAKMTNKLAKDESDNGVPQIRTAHILLKTEKPETLKQEKTLKEIPAESSEEEKTRLNKENGVLQKENEKVRKENEVMVKKNADIEKRNAEKKAKAEEVLATLKETPEKFADLAKEFSEDTSKDKGGDLGYAVPTTYVEPYRNAALALEKGSITQELVQSEFGYHIIKLIDKKEPAEELFQVALLRLPKEEGKEKAEELLKRVREESVYSVERVWFNALPDPWQKTELDGRYFKRADVAYDQTSFRPYVAITFNDEGAKIFEKLTEENVKKRIGIFVGGEFISAPTVQEKISGGSAQITLGTPNVQLALQEANELSRSLNAGTIPAPLKKPNELNIGASLGKESLQKSLYAGAIGLVLVALFMILTYRFMGLLAAAALIIYGLFLIFVIQSQIPPVIAVTTSFFLWLVFAYQLFKSKIDGLAKVIFLTFSVVGVLFVFSVLVNPIVLTLAGIAGLILSIGMAVDANILIFERMKEEFAQGKSFVTSVHDGFERAWSSILDSNVSTLITCAILFYFGSSIIKGFAINLAAGVVISMFTAITVSKTFLLLFEGTAIERVYWLWKRK